ncbi:hypothetical protein [Hymenobacter fodinae]|uniref:Uncharacterized protein n=1 Tax=Hymenobacter fodinae TaxID=2510796 RepID=A0A4Z0P6U0_9BACT|nr:hypothetical protein [Hymenobacter fodinae]TGE08011.1 hypothetical protein EU556_09725 [Hymenobacter fodinae]
MMTFDQNQYVLEMTTMVDKAIERLQSEHPDWEVYTVSIWTDLGAESSAISFDSKAHSDQHTDHYNQFIKPYREALLAKHEYKKAMLYAPVEGRNDNPADFELRDFGETKHTCFVIDWDNATEEDLWDILGPVLLQIGEYVLHKTAILKRHPEFELGINGKLDWYETTWSATGKSVNRLC